MLLTTQQLAQRWTFSEETLRRWRRERIGPAFVKLGGLVRYRVEDVEAYERFYLTACKQPTARQLSEKAERNSRCSPELLRSATPNG